MSMECRALRHHERDGRCWRDPQWPFFGNFDNELTNFPAVFMKKGYICRKFESVIWNVHGKNGIFC